MRQGTHNLLKETCCTVMPCIENSDTTQDEQIFLIKIDILFLDK